MPGGSGLEEEEAAAEAEEAEEEAAEAEAEAAEEASIWTAASACATTQALRRPSREAARTEIRAPAC
jgi:hypothetical protein